ncbi:MAG: ferrous iron transport protein A [Ignavibacteriae bacterium]|nr:MAG: ferrous iron transport protein A [Ignavibacteriota bacterium]
MPDLLHIPLNVLYRIVAVEGDGATAQRVRELGLIAGAVFRVVRRAPFGGPVEIALEQRRIGLRLSDGLKITAEPAV